MNNPFKKGDLVSLSIFMVDDNEPTEVHQPFEVLKVNHKSMWLKYPMALGGKEVLIRLKHFIGENGRLNYYLKSDPTKLSASISLML